MAVLAVLATCVGAGIVALIYRQWDRAATEPERQRKVMLLAESQVKFGVLVTGIYPSGPAEQAGLREQDIIIRYDDTEVRDRASYVEAVEAHRSDNNASLTVWRGGKQTVLTVPPGTIGFRNDDWNPTRTQIYLSLSRRDRAGAAQRLADAEANGLLTPVQSLTLKIILIPNRSSIEKEQERSQLIEGLLRIYPVTDLGRLGTNEFLEHNSYAAAARCFESSLARVDDEDVNIVLNLAISYLRLFEIEKAERTVHGVIDREEPGLSSYGVFVAQQILAGIAMARGRYNETLGRLAPYLASGETRTTMLGLLAAAKLGDLAKFDAISARASAANPDQMRDWQFFVDSIRAYALARTGHKTEALALIRKWGTPSCIVETAASYWDTIPGATDVARQLQSLLDGADQKDEGKDQAKPDVRPPAQGLTSL
jgi:hypothetical protein